MTKKIERIDGLPYVYGSAEHHAAIERAIQLRVAKLQQSGIVDHIRADANQTAFLARDLVYVSRDIQRVLYEKLKAAMFVPVKSDVPEGAENWVYRQTDWRGEARVGAHLQADDAPNAEVATEEFPFPVTYASGSYQYTIEDLKKAAFSGIQLPREKANACAEMIARKLDQLIRVGDADLGITGFFNNPNVPVITLTNGEWLSATAAEILADVDQVEEAVIDETRDVHEVTRLLLPSAYEGRLNSLQVPDTNMSVRKYLFGNGGGERGNARTLKEMERWVALNDATGDDVGVADPPQGIAYDPSPDVVHAVIPVPYQELPPQARGFGWVVNAYAVFAGVVFKRPKAAAYIENLD